MSYDAAAHIFAQKHKVSVFRYLKNEDRNSLSNYKTSTSLPPRNRGNSKKGITEQTVTISSIGNIQDHVISPQIVKEAQKMANVYPIIYVFENSVRIVIKKIMESKYGKDWWKKARIPTKINEKIKIRKKDEDKNRWHGKRGSHEIFYTDIEELVSIIENNWDIFGPHLPKQHIVKAIIEIIATSRNVIAHNNPLSTDDILSLKLNYKKWNNQVKGIKFKLKVASKV